MKTFLKPIVSVLAVTSLLVAGSTFAQYQKAEKNGQKRNGIKVRQASKKSWPGSATHWI